MSSVYRAVLAEGVAALELNLDSAQLDALLDYHQRLSKWNQAYNLSAVREPRAMIDKHLLDSLSVLPRLAESAARHIMDVGTGGGLPGLPLAICLPQCQFTLLDSAGKKARFLTQTVHEMGLANVSVAHCRVEDFQAPHGFDVVISRAFASLADFCQGCAHLLAEGGELWAMKGLFPRDELSDLTKHYKVVGCFPLAVPADIGERCLVVVHPDPSQTSQ